MEKEKKGATLSVGLLSEETRAGEMNEAERKKEILEIYRKLRKEMGKAPSYRSFIKYSGVRRQEMVKSFLTYNNLVKEAGFDTRTFIRRLYTDDDYMNSYGEFIRKHKKLPSLNEWVFYKLRPSVHGLTDKFKCKWSELIEVFQVYSKDKPEWEDVRKIIKEKDLYREPIAREEKSEFAATTTGQHVFIPPVLQDMCSLAFANGHSKEFEIKCRVALGMLGYEVSKLGQGTGRNPDGIAKDLQNRYAVIYDAKARKEFYTLGTDDRAIIEYIRAQKNELHSKGFELIYFLIISSAFGSFSTYRIQSETGVVPSFITAENLLHIVSKKIECPRNYDTGRLKGLFVKGGEITKEEVKRIVN